jgi:hypothetical protein
MKIAICYFHRIAPQNKVSKQLVALMMLVSALLTNGCDRHPVTAIDKNMTLTLRCVIDVYDDTIWARNRNLVIKKMGNGRYYHVIGNPFEFHSKKLSPCPGAKIILDDLIHDTFIFLGTNGEDVRAREDEDKAQLERFIEDAKDGTIDSEEFQQEADHTKPINWTLTFNYGPIETVPATDNWEEEKRTKNELQYTINSGNRSDLAPEFKNLLERFEAIFQGVAEMDSIDKENTDKKSEIPTLIIQE